MLEINFFFHHNSLGDISSLAALNSSSSLPEDFELNNLQKSQYSMNNISDNNHATDPKQSFFVPLDQDDEPSNKDHHLSDLKVDAETLELHRQKHQLKTKYKDALYYIDELKIELEKQIFEQKSLQVLIDYNRFILTMANLLKQDYSKQVVDNLQDHDSLISKALDQLQRYLVYYNALIVNNEDAFLNPKSRQHIIDHQHRALSFKNEFRKNNDFIDFYSSYDYEFKFLNDQINEYDLKPAFADINSHENQAKVDRFDNDYTLKGSIARLNQSIFLSKFTSAKLLIDIDKTKLSVIHSDIVADILNANTILYAFFRTKPLIDSLQSSQGLIDEQTEQKLSLLSQDILIASEKLSWIKNKLNSLYNEYHDVEYEPSKFQEVDTKLKTIKKESSDVYTQLFDLSQILKLVIKKSDEYFL